MFRLVIKYNVVLKLLSPTNVYLWTQVAQIVAKADALWDSPKYLGYNWNILQKYPNLATLDTQNLDAAISFSTRRYNI